MEAQPSIASHANTFASLSDADIDMLCEDGGPPYVEVVQAGGTRSMLRVVEGLAERDRLDRLLIGTDTPTGYGVTSLGVLKTIGDICSLGGVAPETAWAVASGHGAAAFGSDGNVIKQGAVADVVVMDASLGVGSTTPRSTPSRRESSPVWPWSSPTARYGCGARCAPCAPAGWPA